LLKSKHGAHPRKQHDRPKAKRTSVILAKSRKNSVRIFFRCHILSSTRLSEPESVWMRASSGKLESQSDVLRKEIFSKKSVADLVPLEKSG
jgi:hypothetical protein